MNGCHCEEQKLCTSCRDRAEREWVRDGVMPPPDYRQALTDMWSDVLTGPSVEEERVYGRHRSFGDYFRDLVVETRKPPQAAASLIERAPELTEATDADLREAWEDAA